MQRQGLKWKAWTFPRHWISASSQKFWLASSYPWWTCVSRMHSSRDKTLQFLTSFPGRCNMQGRSGPKKNVCKKSVKDHIEEAAKKKRKMRAWMFCKTCPKFNHDTDQWMRNPMNQVNIFEAVLNETADCEDRYGMSIGVWTGNVGE